MKNSRINAIDIGTSKVCSLIAETDGSGIRILGAGISASHGLQKGQVANINEAREAIRNSIYLAEKTAGCRMHSAVISVTGKQIVSWNKRGVISITSNKKQNVLPGDVRRVLDISRSETLSPEDSVLHQIPKYYRVDGQDGVKNPVGMHGYRLDVETHTVTAPLNSIENLVKCINGAGVKVDSMVFEPIASSLAVLTEDEKRDGVILADIGAGTTNVAAYNNDSIFISLVIPVAGNQITRDISMGLGLSIDVSEELKLKYGSVIPISETDRKKNLAGKGQNIPYQDLFDITKIRTEELLRLIVIQLQNALENTRATRAFDPTAMVLCGGTANLPGIVELAQEVTGIPCRIGYPPQVSGIADNMDDPACAASFGLLIWKMEHPRPIFKHQVSVKAAGTGGLLANLLK